MSAPAVSRTDAVLSRIRNNVRERANVDMGLRAIQQLHSKRMRALELFRPFPYQDEFLLCDSTEVLVRGGTRSGKSTIIGASIASYALGEDIHMSNGVKIPMREPHFMDKTNGIIWIIGKQVNHSSTIYRLLFEPGAFQIVKDPFTKQWRAWQPGFIPGDDKIPKSQLKPAPPFIYPSEVEFGWISRKDKEWNTATLANGWVIKYYPSNGEPKRGDPVHRVWIDEEIHNDVDLYPELQSRLSDYSGRIWWSSWPDMTCPSLIALYERAVEEMIDWKEGRISKCDVYEMRFAGSSNPVIDEEEKRKRTKGWDSATAAARDLGEFNRETVQSYPEFKKSLHTVDYGGDDHRNDEITEILRENNYLPPRDWCVYLILDPGTANPGVLKVAIPPPPLWYQGVPYHIPYFELTGRWNAAQIAHIVKEHEPRRVYQRFIIDGKCGDQTPPGYVEKIMTNYSMAFEKEELKSVDTEYRFQRGETSWTYRSMALKILMAPIMEDATRPALRLVSHNTPRLIEQIQKNLRNIQKNDVQDKQAVGQKKDLLDCLEYYAAANPVYVYPKRQEPDKTQQYKTWQNEIQFWESMTGSPDRKKSASIVCGID